MRNSLLLFSIIISVALSSCKKEGSPDTPVTPGSSKVKTYSEDYSSGSTHIAYTFNLNYDSKDRIVSMVSTGSAGDRFEYKYSASSYAFDIYNSNTLSIHEIFFINSNSLIDSSFAYNDTQDSSTEKYIYNASKQLVKLIEYDYSKVYGSQVSNTTNYLYDVNGNQIKATDSYTTITYEYYPDRLYNIYVGVSYLPVAKNAIKTTTVFDGYDTEVLHHVYAYDGSDRIISETVTSDSGETLIKSYTY